MVEPTPGKRIPGQSLDAQVVPDLDSPNLVRAYLESWRPYWSQIALAVGLLLVVLIVFRGAQSLQSQTETAAWRVLAEIDHQWMATSQGPKQNQLDLVNRWQEGMKPYRKTHAAAYTNVLSLCYLLEMGTPETLQQAETLVGPALADCPHPDLKEQLRLQLAHIQFRQAKYEEVQKTLALIRTSAAMRYLRPEVDWLRLQANLQLTLAASESATPEVAKNQLEIVQQELQTFIGATGSIAPDMLREAKIAKLMIDDRLYTLATGVPPTAVGRLNGATPLVKVVTKPEGAGTAAPPVTITPSDPSGTPASTGPIGLPPKTPDTTPAPGTPDSTKPEATTLAPTPTPAATPTPATPPVDPATAPTTPSPSTPSPTTPSPATPSTTAPAAPVEPAGSPTGTAPATDAPTAPSDPTAPTAPRAPGPTSPTTTE